MGEVAAAGACELYVVTIASGIAGLSVLWDPKFDTATMLSLSIKVMLLGKECWFLSALQIQEYNVYSSWCPTLRVYIKPQGGGAPKII